MGFLAAVLSTPCSFAILAASFAWAQAQNVLLGTTGIMGIGVGMALPYLLLTLMPGLLGRLPRAGQWMEIFKQGVGFILLGIAVWFFTILPEQYRAEAMFFALVLGFCVWMFGSWVGYNSKMWQKLVVRSTAVLIAIISGFLILGGGGKGEIQWRSYDESSIEQALEEGSPVLIKFTADWCLSCKVVDRLVFSREDVARLMEEKDVLAVKADTTLKDSAATRALKDKYDEPGVPVSILLLPGEEEPVRWRGKAFADELKEKLRGAGADENQGGK